MTLTPDTLMAFVVATLIISLSPGPSNLYIMACTLGSGRTGGTADAVRVVVGAHRARVGAAPCRRRQIDLRAAASPRE